MLIPVIAPRLITDFGVGELFYTASAGLQLNMVCAGDGDHGEARYVVALPADAADVATAPAIEVRIRDLGEFAGQAALPVFRAGVFCPPFAAVTNSGNGVPKATALAFADAAGCWMPINDMWLNLSTGLLSAHRPSAPWVELGAVELRAADGETIIQWSIF